ncbi:MAG: WD40 repeat domain-containing protein [Polyangiaceae bacterium]
MGPRTAEGWRTFAAEAAQQGNLDVAAHAWRNAYALSRDAMDLGHHIKGLILAGQYGAAREVWASEKAAAGAANSELAKRLDKAVRALPATPAPLPLEAPPPPAALLTAYEAEAAGRRDDAVQHLERGLLPDSHPSHTAHLGDLLWAQRDPVRARSTWSKARSQLREGGAHFELVPVARWYTRALANAGDKIALVRFLQPIDTPSSASTEVQIWPVGPSPSLALRSFVAASLEAPLFLPDGRHLLMAVDGEIALRDSFTGGVVERFSIGDKTARVLSASGSPGDLHVLSSSGSAVTLWGPSGKEIGQYTLSGKTPTITRVYRAGQGTHHDNILGDAPSWAVSGALSRDLRFVAVGGSDSKVRLFNRTTKKEQVLSHAWGYVEHRHMGGNPDLNKPLDMRFSEAGDTLVVAYSHGEMITWSTGTGKAVRTLDGRCSVDEATALVNRYKGSGAPHRVPTDEEQKDCGGSVGARLSPDLSSIVTTGAGARIRDVKTGAGLAFLLEERLPEEHLAWSQTGTLAMADIYGAVALWSPGDKAARDLLPRATASVIDPAIAAGGRVLSFELDGQRHTWDMTSRKPLSLGTDPATPLLALAADGMIAARRTSAGVEIFDMATGAVLTKHALEKRERVTAQLSATGRTALLAIERLPDREIVLCDLDKDACKPASFSGTGTTRLSRDGRFVAASTAGGGDTQVWSIATGKAVSNLGEHARAVRFSADGSTVAWFEQSDPHSRDLTVHARRLGPGKEPGESFEAKVEGWPADLGISGGGSVVWVLLEGSLLRWDVGEAPAPAWPDTPYVSGRRLHLSPDDKLLFLESYHGVSVYSAAPGAAPLARIYPLLSGGFLTVTTSGAVDGSPDAPEHLITRVTRSGETAIFDGRFGWEAAHVEGSYDATLAGRDEAPVIPGANGDPVTSL